MERVYVKALRHDSGSLRSEWVSLSDVVKTILEELEKKKTESVPKNDVHCFVDMWNQFCGKMPKIKHNPSEKREKLIRKALHKNSDFEFWRSVIVAASKNAFLTGNNNRKWVASIDFVLRPGKAEEILEGNYGKNKTTSELLL